MNNPQGKRLIPEYLLKYLRGVKENGLNITELVDSKGNPRFIEGDGEALEQEGLNISYCKWSLSGTHLMLVVAGNVENTTEIVANSVFGNYVLPDFIKEKIYPVWTNMIEAKIINLYAEDWSSQTLQFKLAKTTTGLRIETAALTLSKTRSFRVQFDLLIDSE